MRRLSDAELAMFSEEIAMILRSGLLLPAGVRMLAEDAGNPFEKNLFDVIGASLDESRTFSGALKETGAFPGYFSAMTEIGEESGKLEEIMSGLSDYYNRQRSMKEALKSAVLYPSVLIALLVALLAFLSAAVFPVFQKVFADLGAVMNPGAEFLIRAGTAVGHRAEAIIFAMALLALAAGLGLKTKKGKASLNRFLANRKMMERFSAAAFTSSMALTLSSGMDMEKASVLAAGAMPESRLKEKAGRIAKEMEENKISFGEAMEQTGMFSGAAMGILTAGYKSGRLDHAMQYISELYEEEYQSGLIKGISLIEPVSNAAVSVLAGTILVSVMFPLLGIMASIG